MFRAFCIVLTVVNTAVGVSDWTKHLYWDMCFAFLGALVMLFIVSVETYCRRRRVP